VRETYIIKRPGIKDDFKDPLVNKTGQSNRIEYLLEMACNEMFGNFEAGHASKIDMNKYFTLHKAEVALFNREAWNLYFNFELLKSGATHFERSQHSRAFDCLYLANEIMNECTDPFNLEQQRAANQKIEKFLKDRPNSPSQHQIYAVGHCHIDTAWLWPYAETKRKIARSWCS